MVSQILSFPDTSADTVGEGVRATVTQGQGPVGPAGLLQLAEAAAGGGACFRWAVSSLLLIRACRLHEDHCWVSAPHG